jgi:hypothetical protein
MGKRVKQNYNSASKQHRERIINYDEEPWKSKQLNFSEANRKKYKIKILNTGI